MAVTVLTVLVVGLLFQRFSWSDWSRPQWLEGDPVEVFTRVKIAGEQPGHALFHFNHIDRLGAPTGADWSAYPVPDRLVFVLTGWLGRALGLIAAVQWVAALILGLNAASFYLCARWLRCRVEWALAGALLFALASYNIRWGITLSFSQVFVLPPLVLLCARAARRAPARDAARGWLVLGTLLGVWLGLANPYLAYFAGVVAGGALVLALVRRSPVARRQPLFVFLGCLVASFLLANAAYLAPRLSGATHAVLPRGPGDFAVYALRPLEWLIPPADHRVPALGQLGAAYLSAHRGAGEFFYNYLGLLGIAGLAALLVRAAGDVAQRHWSRLDAAWGLLWIVVFAMPGGLNRWLGAAGLDVFRAGTRIGVYALVWALFFIAGWLSRKTVRWPRGLSVALALVLAVVANWEQTPPFGGRDATAANVARWEDCTTLTTALEASLPPHATIFQLPVVPFPEAGRTGQMPDYAHALPFLTSQTLEFSYGHLRPEPALAWSYYVSRRPAAEMIPALEHAGFSALWIDTRAYPDQAETLLAALKALNLAEQTGADRASGVHVFLLHPAAHPQMPDFADPRLNEHWNDRAPEGQPLLLALHGWFGLEDQGTDSWRWATRQAALGLWWDGAPTHATLHFQLGGPPGNRVILRQDRQTLLSAPAGGHTYEVGIKLRPGLNTVNWQLDGAVFRPGGGDPRRLGFMVENLSVSVP